MRAGDKVEGEQGQEHRRWLKNILPWRRWKEKWSWSYTEARLHRESVRGVKRVSDRMMYMKLDIEGVMMTVISAYAPRVGCLRKEKDKFWIDLDEVVESIRNEERLVIGADFNWHVGEGNRGDENVMGRYVDKARNAEGQMLVDFATRMEMAVVNTYFKKREEDRVTYKSGGRSTQVDYIIM